MKISKKPTEWVWIPVSDSQGVNVIDFVLIRLTPEYRSFLRQRADVAKAISYLPNAYSLNFWNAPQGWYAYNDDFNKGPIIKNSYRWCFIEFDHPEEYEDLKKAAQRMESEYISFFGRGSAQFFGTPKDEETERYTAEFAVELILDRLDEAFGAV